MWWTKFIHWLFMIPEKRKEQKRITVKDLSILDTVWIKENDILYKGWIFDITRRCIIVVYGQDLRDFRFRIDKFFNDTIIEQDNRILYCNNPEFMS